MQSRLLKLPEPLLLFRHGQAMEDPRDGLTLFGPLDFAAPLGVRAGLVGTDPLPRRPERICGRGPRLAMGTGVRTSDRRVAESWKESVRPKGGGALSAAR
jgi:hypothetical protein